MQTVKYRLVPVLIPGKKWAVEVAIGNRKKGTRRAAQITDPVYTLAQAQMCCDRNKSADFAYLLT